MPGPSIAPRALAPPDRSIALLEPLLADSGILIAFLSEHQAQAEKFQRLVPVTAPLTQAKRVLGLYQQ